MQRVATDQRPCAANVELIELSDRIIKRTREVNMHFRVHANCSAAADAVECELALALLQSGELQQFLAQYTEEVRFALGRTCHRALALQRIRRICTFRKSQSRLNRSKQSNRFARHLIPRGGPIFARITATATLSMMIVVGVALTYRTPAD
jgi:hypothetical protein